MKKIMFCIRLFLLTMVFLTILFAAHEGNGGKELVQERAASFPTFPANGAFLAPVAETMPIFTEADLAGCSFVPNLPLKTFKEDTDYYSSDRYLYPGTFSWVEGTFKDTGIYAERKVIIRVEYNRDPESYAVDLGIHKDEWLHLKDICIISEEDKVVVEDINPGEMTFVLRCWNQYKGFYCKQYNDNFFVTINIDGPSGQSIESGDAHLIMNEQMVKDLLMQAKACAEKAIENKQIRGKVTDAWGTPLPYMVVTFTYGGKEYETTTDEQGRYRMPFNGEYGKKGSLSVYFEYKRNDSIYFVIVRNFDEPFQMDVDFTPQNSGDLEKDFVVQGDQKGFEWMGYLYLRLHEAVNFYITVLNLTPELVNVGPFVFGIDTSQYVEEKKLIAMSINDVVYKGYRDTLPVSAAVYHEYSHHIMNCLYHGIPKGPSDAQIKEINHAGYSNPSTTDSLIEGFAVFMAQVIKDHLGMTENRIDEKTGRIEQNFLAWGSEGYDELFAAAGIFLDLYDDSDEKDNDPLQLTLEQIWEVLKVRRQNMYEAYQAFITTYPDRKPDIDQIFINHGFFADTDKGNGTYDPGEPVRKDKDGTVTYFVDLANPVICDNKKINGSDTGEQEDVGQATNYQRPERRYPVPIPAHFIKTDNTFPFYTIRLSFTGYESLDHEIAVEQMNGLIPIPVPPEQYDATITIEGYGDGVATGNPLRFTNHDFLSDYARIIEKGYFLEHDFAITGPEPVKPDLDPSLISRLEPGCAASVLFGKDDPRLDTMRRFRDQVLRRTPEGRELISLYYQWSPALAKAMEDEAFKAWMKEMLEGLLPLIEGAVE